MPLGEHHITICTYEVCMLSFKNLESIEMMI
jgi:NADH:ubiquinone oxidoreductase subunit E